MNKKSYHSSREERLHFLDKLVFNPQSERATEAVGRGYSAQEFAQDINGYTDPHLLDEDISNGKTLEEPIHFLEDLNQALQDTGDIVSADFVNLLIEKFAEEKIENPSKKFNDLILKIKDTDLPDTNDAIKKLTNIFSRTVLLEFENQGDLGKAKDSAYKKTLHRAEQYLNSGKMLKVAQSEKNPLLVAQNIKGIIDILVSRFSPEARLRSYPNLRSKILRLNQNDIANKKSPGGAAIGTAITLIKNILNGRDRSFISAVITNLGMLLR